MVIVGVLIFLVSLKMRPKNNNISKLEPLFRGDSAGQLLSSTSNRSLDVASNWLNVRPVEGIETSQMALTTWPQLAAKSTTELEHHPSGYQSTHQIGELEPEPFGSDSILSYDSQQADWTPANYYSEGHQASIETALSNVLTVSTLVGFRAHKANPSHCCLHHAVQLTKVSSCLYLFLLHSRVEFF